MRSVFNLSRNGSLNKGVRFFYPVWIIVLFFSILNCELREKENATDRLLKELVNGAATPSSAGANDSDNKYFKVGGTISGMDGGKSITLANNLFEVSVFVFNGPFSFPYSYVNNTTYSVSITSQPVGQTCTLANQNGSILNADVTSVIILCN